ncbi:MAG: EutN/CcmL family microcompartment protein [Candidatus Tritonobacter lacicola]|nr:EutN/CcmL family microcompartment protein [Candidatus Tritonobacter lacicola]
MLLGRVVGTLVSTRKIESIEGLKLLVVQPVTTGNRPAKGYVIAIDVVGANTGEIVLYSQGSATRQTPETDKCPVDGLITAIVDTWEVGGKEVYNKSGSEKPA